MGAERELDRRCFLAGAAAAGVALATGCASVRPAATAVRAAAVRTARVPRKLSDAIRGQVLERGTPGFLSAAHVYNERYDAVLPRAVARPVDAADVRAAVRWALAHDVPLRARSGGHSYAGYSTLAGGVVLDLRHLRAIEVDRRARTATIGAGAQLIDVYTALAGHGATIPAGSCPSVGIAGHALGGGMGLAGRAFGLTTDNLIAATLVTADGGLHEVDDRADPELLWALRGGGGGNFGVVTGLRLHARPLPARASYFFVSWPWSSASDAIAAWQSWAPHARDELTSIFHLETGGGTPVVSVSGQYLGPARALGRLLAPLRAVAGASISVGDQDYRGLQLRWAGCLHTGLAACHTAGTRPGGMLARASFAAKSDYVTRPLSGTGRATLLAAIERRASESGSAAILFDAYGGAINRVEASATAFVHRRALYCIQYLSYDGGASWLAQTNAAMRRYVSGMAYQNYIDPELAGWQHAYYGDNYPRLRGIRRRVDPEHRFDFPQAIGR